MLSTTGTLTGSATSTVSLNQLNTIANLGAFTSNGAFTLNDTTGGLNVTGAVSTTNNGLASITTTGGNLAVTTGSVAGAGVTLITTGLNDIALGGNVSGNAGIVTLTSGRAISQSAGVLSTTGTLTGSATSTVSLNQLNTIANLGAFTSTGAFLLNDLQGLELTGNLLMGDNFAISTTGAVTDSPGISIDVTNDSRIIATGGAITLNDTAADILIIRGNAAFSGTVITLGSLGSANFGSLTFTSAGLVTVQEDSETVLSVTSTAGSLVLNSAGTITDALNTSLTVTGLANLNSGANNITLGDNVGDTTNFGSLTFTSAGLVKVQEDSDTLLTGTNTANNLDLASSGAITEGATASLEVVNLAKIGAVGNIKLTNSTNTLNQLTVTNATNVAIRDVDSGNNDGADQSLTIVGDNKFSGTAFVIATQNGIRFKDFVNNDPTSPTSPTTITGVANSKVVLIGGSISGLPGVSEVSGNLQPDGKEGLVNFKPGIDGDNTDIFFIANSLQSASSAKGSFISPINPLENLRFNYKFSNSIDDILTEALSGNFGASLGNDASKRPLDSLKGDSAIFFQSAPFTDLAISDAADKARNFLTRSINTNISNVGKIGASIDRASVAKSDGLAEYAGPFWTIGYDYDLYELNKERVPGLQFPLYYLYNGDVLENPNNSINLLE